MSLVEHLLVYDYNLDWFHRDQQIVDAHSDNFRIDVTLFLLSHNILICGAVCYGQAYQRHLINQDIHINGGCAKCCVMAAQI